MAVGDLLDTGCRMPVAPDANDAEVLCGAPLEVTKEYTLLATLGDAWAAAEHHTVQCLNGHWYDELLRIVEGDA